MKVNITESRIKCVVRFISETSKIREKQKIPVEMKTNLVHDDYSFIEFDLIEPKLGEEFLTIRFPATESNVDVMLASFEKLATEFYKLRCMEE